VFPRLEFFDNNPNLNTEIDEFLQQDETNAFLCSHLIFDAKEEKVERTVYQSSNKLPLILMS